jgi:hypothetical protein
MLVKVHQNGMGHLTLSPVNERTQAKFAKHLQQFNNNADGTIYMQLDSEVDEFLASLPSGKGKAVSQGWTERIRMDEWEFATMLGYDATNAL